MRTIFYPLIFFININAVFTQSIRIDVKNLETSTASFSYLEGENEFHIASLKAKDNSYFTIIAEKYNLDSGIYRLRLKKNKWLDFVYSGKSVKINTDNNGLFDKLKVIESKENELFYKFIRLTKSYKIKTELLQVILYRYPKDDGYHSITQKKLSAIQKEYSQFTNVTSQQIPSSFIARYIKSAQLPVVDASLSRESQRDYLKKHSLDNVDFNDANLIYSNAFTNKTIEYLTYYSNPQLPKELLEKEFIVAVDRLLNKAKINQLVYQHITDYLISGFKEFGFDKIIDYIVENYVIEDDLCLDKETENSIQRRIDQAKSLSVGAKAPNLIMQDESGVVIDLLKMESEKTLLVFYASWCPYCQELLPQLSGIKKSNEEVNILAISLDSEKEVWLKFIKDNSLDLTNLNDPNGWDGTAASEYHIYATPTMFLLNKEKNIIGKPANYKELQRLL